MTVEKNALDYYKDLLKMDYDSAINQLKKEHGKVQKDYFGEISYNNFIKGYSKSPKLTKDDKTSEGLYRHHIAENEENHQNLGNKESIKKLSDCDCGCHHFNLQKKENLVYCDLIEHIILHRLISEDNRGYYSLMGIFHKWILNEKEYKKKRGTHHKRVHSNLRYEQAIILWNDYFKNDFDKENNQSNHKK